MECSGLTFDLYCPPVAEATVAMGREVITQTINKAKELGIQVLYGDTDSLFLKERFPDDKLISEAAEYLIKAAKIYKKIVDLAKDDVSPEDKSEIVSLLKEASIYERRAGILMLKAS